MFNRMVDRAETLDLAFAALADPTRRAIVDRLARRGPATVGDLADPFDMSLNAVSKHIKALERAGLVCVVLTVVVALSYLTVKLPDLTGAGEGHGESLADSFGLIVAALAPLGRARWLAGRGLAPAAVGAVTYLAARTVCAMPHGPWFMPN